MNEFRPDKRCTQFNIEGTNYYGYRKGELGDYTYIAYKMNANGICKELVEDTGGEIRVTINGARVKTSKEVLVCEMCRQGGLYADRLNLGVIGFENYESLVTGEIRNTKLPDRPKRIYGSYLYQVHSVEKGGYSYLHGIKTRASIDPRLNRMVSWGVEESTKHGFVRPIDRILLTNSVMFNWKDFEEKKRILVSDVVWVHDNIPHQDNLELLVDNHGFCVAVDKFNEIGMVLYDVNTGITYNLENPKYGFQPNLLMEERRDLMIWKPMMYNFKTSKWYSKDLTYGATNKLQKQNRGRFYWTFLKKGDKRIEMI